MFIGLRLSNLPSNFPSHVWNCLFVVVALVLASFRFEGEDEDKDENEDQGQLFLIVRMLKSMTVMA